MTFTRLATIGIVIGLGRTAVAADPAELERLHAAARDLSSTGNCDAVKDMATQVRQLDMDYYHSVFLADGAIASCWAPPARNAWPQVAAAQEADIRRAHATRRAVARGARKPRSGVIDEAAATHAVLARSERACQKPAVHSHLLDAVGLAIHAR